jgi:hypothetical protein
MAGAQVWRSRLGRKHHCHAGLFQSTPNDGALFTLTSGILADQAWPRVTGGAIISGAAQLRAVHRLPAAVRPGVYVVSPSVIGDSADAFADDFPGMRLVPMDELVRHYRHRRGEDLRPDHPRLRLTGSDALSLTIRTASAGQPTANALSSNA